MQSFPLVLDFTEAERTIASLCALSQPDDKAQFGICLQAPETNSEDVLFGACGATVGILAPGKNLLLPVKDAKSMSIGRPSDNTLELIVHLV